MHISLELEQNWGTAAELREYLGKLERTLQRICEMEAEAPTEWYLEIDVLNINDHEFDIKLTHL